MLTDAELLDLAGKAAFARGRAYHAQGRVTLARAEEDRLDGEARGSEDYPLWLRRENDRWRWGCACPAADDGAFCKHLVAAVLAAHGQAAEESGEDVAPKKRAAKGRRAPAAQGDLLDFLRAQPAERLAGWLKALADEDASIEKRLNLHRAAEDPAALKSALGKMLSAGGFLDYRGSIAYARRLDAVIAQLEGQIARDAAAGRTLCEYALGRVLKNYANSDDSSGAIGDRLATIAALHARACAALEPGKALAKALMDLQRDDNWDLFPLEAYWAALGGEGQAEYGRMIADEFAALPAKPSEDQRWGKAFGIRRRAEAFARASGDFDFLQRVLRNDLTRAHDHLRVLESLREFGRDREALAFAEQAVKKFPNDAELRTLLAECLGAAGLDREAVEAAWEAFRLHSEAETWDALKRIAGTKWPAWRERALAEVAARERGDAAERVVLLDHDGDFESAVALAMAMPVHAGVLDDLARRLERDRPIVAGEFYLRIAESMEHRLDYAIYPRFVSTLKKAARCLPEERWQPVAAAARATHGRKTKLMALMGEAGL